MIIEYRLGAEDMLICKVSSAILPYHFFGVR